MQSEILNIELQRCTSQVIDFWVLKREMTLENELH